MKPRGLANRAMELRESRAVSILTASFAKPSRCRSKMRAQKRAKSFGNSRPAAT